MLITRLDCPGCETRIEGRFSQSRFGRLSPSQLAFLEVFVRNRGVIKDVEAELGISYPTVRARLDDVLRAMDAVTEQAAPRSASRREVLEALRDGRLSAERAAALLRDQNVDD